jgi:hypothetical protein
LKNRLKKIFYSLLFQGTRSNTPPSHETKPHA